MVKTVVIILVFGAAIGGFIFWKMSRKNKSKVKKAVNQGTKMAKEVLKTHSPESDIEQIRVDLFLWNLRVRTKKGFTETMILSFEVLVNKLDDIIPKMKAKWPDNDLTWETERIATTHLPAFMEKFIALSVEQLEAKEEQFLASLTTIEVEVDEVVALYNKNAENEAGTRSNIIKKKFEQAPSEV